MTRLAAVPALWRGLYFEINSGAGRVPDGITGIRDVDAPCEAFVLVESERPDGGGDCETDGHYLCAECTRIKLAVLRRRHDECEECGAVLPRRGLDGLGDCLNGCHDQPWASVAPLIQPPGEA